MGSFMLACLVLLPQGLQGIKHCPKSIQNITVSVGGTAHLPCSFSPPMTVNKEGARVSWQKKDSELDLVVHFQNGKEEGDQQDEIFRGRTLVDRHWFHHGNAKLRLQEVTEEDSGTYTCWITLLPLRPSTQHMCCVVTLTVTEIKTQMVAKADNDIMNTVLGWTLLLLIMVLLSCLPWRLTYKHWPEKKKMGVLWKCGQRKDLTTNVRLLQNVTKTNDTQAEY